MPLVQLWNEFNGFEIVAAVVEFKRELRLANLADHLSISVCVLLAEVLRRLLFDLIKPDGHRTGSLLCLPLRGGGGLRPYSFGAPLRD